MNHPPTPRWTPLRFHPVQHSLRASRARFRVVAAGRRSGKTELAKRFLVTRALAAGGVERPRFFAAAPTREQARRIFWDDLKELIPERFLEGRPSETELMIRLVNGAELYVLGLDRPERMEGQPWDGGVVDEVANVHPGAWPENLRPALSDRAGWCWLVGVPEGRNHYYKLWKAAKADKSGLWAAFHWKSADILPPEEIEAARRELDELTFRQEYEADFLNFSGRAYYTFDPETHCAPLAYDPARPLILTFDFNVSPGTAAVIQEQTGPEGRQVTGIIGEVWIPDDSNTPEVCRRLTGQWGGHAGPVLCYGDASGGSRGTASVAGSDWDLVRASLEPVFGARLSLRVPRRNPPERARVNIFNSRLRSAGGEVRLVVDPQKAPRVVMDLEGVRLASDGSGAIDKKADPELTHLSDGIGYYLAAEFPLAQREAKSVKIMGVY